MRTLSQQIRRRIGPAIRELGEHPRAAGCEKFVGSRDRYRIRVGDYRVGYEVNDDQRQIVSVLASRAMLAARLIVKRPASLTGESSFTISDEGNERGRVTPA